MKAKTRTKTPPENAEAEQHFPIVSIGASAGGLEAVMQLLNYLPEKTGMAYVYVQHISPDYKSMLADLLTKSTTMKVQEATDMIPVVPDNFYVIPPGKEMFVADGHIKLVPRSKKRKANTTIDSFFISLAEKHKENVIGIILSGSASDGTRGLKAIKEQGGITFAQDTSAKFGSMPQSAIAEGVVDFILPPADIAMELARLSKQFQPKSAKFRFGEEDHMADDSPDLLKIFQLLLKETGVDFNRYKRNTIKRRIIRRMMLQGMELPAYANYISSHRTEVDILYQDLLINVTSFFRDGEVYDYLKTEIFPGLLQAKAPGQSLRIWVPACSTGEEAYSLAMTLLELQTESFNNINIQIFATDLSEPAIARARLGEYSVADVQAVSPNHLKRFYTRSDGTYRISRAVREMCLFAPHNILKDPPFTQIDFISCCNLMIYLDNDSQKQVFSTFHYALREKGFLMLGKSESIGSSSLFSKHSKKFKVYLRQTTAEPSILKFNYHPAAAGRSAIAVKAKSSVASATDWDGRLDKMLLAKYLPATLILNKVMEVVQFRGQTAPYLEHSQGKASLNIFKIIRSELIFELRVALQRALKSGEVVEKSNIELTIAKEKRIVRFEIHPLTIEWDEPILILQFFDMGKVNEGAEVRNTVDEKKIKKVEEELAAAYQHLQSITEDFESANAELQSANEEILSSNEELQTLNEELETSREEVESANEELVTINEELQTRNELITESYEYTQAILSTIHEPLLVLDHMLRVKSSNQAFYRMFQMSAEGTVGVPLFELMGGQWSRGGLLKLLSEIIPQNTQIRDFEMTGTFNGSGERKMLINAQRILQKNQSEQLILLAISDITQPALQILKQHNMELEKLVAQRTAEIEASQKELVNKNHELKQMNAELQSFAYVSSHDLQEPLRKIQTFADRIRERELTNLSDQGREAFARMQEAARRMQNLIQDLLAYSRVNTMERQFIRTDLRLIVAEVAEDFSELLEEKKATIHIGPLDTINIIPFQFRQLIFNLVSNSLKFISLNEDPGIWIQSSINKGDVFKAEGLKPDADYCKIVVRDNGIGFEPEFSKRIFEMFQRLHSREAYVGTGVGLAICKKIVENHYGIIIASGELNKGATFEIYIPLKQGNQ